jgi:hypothetical protein
MSTTSEIQIKIPNEVREAIEESWEPIFPDAAEPGGCNFAKGCAWRPQKILLTAPGSEIIPILERYLAKIEKLELLSNISKDELFEYLKKWDHNYLCLGEKYDICKQEINAEKAIEEIEEQEIKTVFLIGETVHVILFVPWWRWRQ